MGGLSIWGNCDSVEIRAVDGSWVIGSGELDSFSSFLGSVFSFILISSFLLFLISATIR